MIEELIKYNFKNKELNDMIINLNDGLVSLGDNFINNYVSRKLFREFLYVNDNDVVSYFDIDMLNNLKLKLVSNDNFSERIVKLHINDIYDKNDKYADLFKAIVGGYVIDNSNIDYDYIDYLLNIDDAILLSIENTSNYYKLVYEWNKNKYKETPKFEVKYDNEFNVSVRLNEIDKIFSAKANTKYLALIYACKEAYSYLEENNLLLKMEDIVGYADIDKCINQLQELFVKGFISEPQYKIQMKGSSNGVDIWKCRVLIDGYKESFSSEDTSKKTAKRNAAFQMLKYIMEEK
ncbi:MAG: hypothetical protein IKP77_04150 [Acholeplasmatales bacterium]|nr:hypothetical protein [Acholeplasmatales bacterium]